MREMKRAIHSTHLLESSQFAFRQIVYELNTLRYKAWRFCAIIPLIIGSYADESQTTTTVRCQAAAGPLWDNAHLFMSGKRIASLLRTLSTLFARGTAEVARNRQSR